MEKFCWMELSSRQFKRYIMEGGDIAALPVGSMEVTGPHLPLGAKMFVCQAIAQALCRAQGGLCLPPIPASPVYDAHCLPGSIDIEHRTMLDYVEDVVDEAMANGIRRLVLVSYYEELYYTIHEHFQKHDITMILVNPGHMRILRENGAHAQFNALVAGSLHLLGEQALLDKMLKANDKCIKEGGFECPDDQDTLQSLRMFGVFPHTYRPGEFTVMPVESIDAQAAAAAIETWAKSQDEVFKAFSEYNHVLARTRHDRGLRQGGYGYVE